MSDAGLAEGWARLRAGALAEAEAIGARELARQPEDAQALALVALARSSGGDHAGAVPLLRDLAARQPSGLNWANLGTSLRALGEFDAAMDAYRRAAHAGMQGADFLVNVALLHIDRFEHAAARALLERAAQAAPDDAQVRFLQALCAYRDTDDARAREILADWQCLQNLDEDRLLQIAGLLIQLGETAAAESALRGLVQRSPARAAARVRLAQLLERANQVEEAQSLIADFDPQGLRGEEHEDFLAVRARLRERAGDAAGAEADYGTLLSALPAPHQRFHALFPLARVLDARGDVDGAMRALAQAHDSQLDYLRRSVPGLFADAAPQAFNIADYGCDPADVARWPEDGPLAAQSPVFIVGFPRSGTTLLEQALDAHPALRAMDEQPFLQYAIDEIQNLGVRYPEALAELGPAQADAVRARYLRRCAAGGRRVLDKNPLNLLRLPAIRRLFPRAHIVLALRHPCDVILSNYQQHYRAPEIALMCRDLGALAEGYDRAFSFWSAQQALLKADVFELRYEDLVADFEGRMRALLEFLGLPWDAAVLRPAERARARGYISTPSYSQVIEPVNAKAVGRWQPYARHFGAALPILAPWLERWTYSADLTPPGRSPNSR